MAARPVRNAFGGVVRMNGAPSMVAALLESPKVTDAMAEMQNNNGHNVVEELNPDFSNPAVVLALHASPKTKKLAKDEYSVRRHCRVYR